MYNRFMTWDEIKQRKEESIRESTGNPMSIDNDGKKYESFSEYLNSEEYKEYLDLQEKALKEYTQKAKDYFNSFDTDNQLLLFFHITNTIFKNYFNDNGSYRGLLYNKFGFGPEAYSLGLDSGMFALHNSISTPKDNEERFNALMKFLDLDLSKEQMYSARNYFDYGFDQSKNLKDMFTGQQKFDFNKDTE